MAAISHVDLHSAIFAGGCFWCVEADFKKRPEIKDIESGYIGGESKDPSYETAAGEGHREAVRVWFSPEETSYRELLAYFFSIHDPTDAGGSFHDRGHTYTSAIYYENLGQEETARAALADLQNADVFSAEIATEILPAGEFWPAEEYHQDYAQKNQGHYEMYRKASGRDEFTAEHQEKIYRALGVDV